MLHLKINIKVKHLICLFLIFHCTGLFAQDIFGSHLVNQADVPLRTIPRSSGSIVKILEEGTGVIPLERASADIEIGQSTGNWIKVQTAQDEGYMLSTYLSYNHDGPRADVYFGLVHQGSFGPIYRQSQEGREYIRENSVVPGRLSAEEYILEERFFQDHPQWEGMILELDASTYSFSILRSWSNHEEATGFIFAGPQLPENIRLTPDIRCSLSSQQNTQPYGYSDLRGEKSPRWQLMEAQVLSMVEDILTERAQNSGLELYPDTLLVQGVSLWSDQFFYLSTIWLSPLVDGKSRVESFDQENVVPHGMVLDGFFRIHRGEVLFLGESHSLTGDVFEFDPNMQVSAHALQGIFDADGDGYPEFWMDYYHYESSESFWIFTQDESIERSPVFGRDGLLPGQLPM